MKKKGICYVCGCTADEGCIEVGGACTWTDEEQTLCSTCEPLSESKRKKRRAEKLREMRAWVKSILDDVDEILERVGVLQAEARKKP